jgi:hypothetical protein
LSTNRFAGAVKWYCQKVGKPTSNKKIKEFIAAYIPKTLPRRNLAVKSLCPPPEEAIEEGITKWKSILVGQFLDKPLPFFLVKKSVAIMWKQHGKVEVFFS